MVFVRLTLAGTAFHLLCVFPGMYFPHFRFLDDLHPFFRGYWMKTSMFSCSFPYSYLELSFQRFLFFFFLFFRIYVFSRIKFYYICECFCLFLVRIYGLVHVKHSFLPSRFLRSTSSLVKFDVDNCTIFNTYFFGTI